MKYSELKKYIEEGKLDTAISKAVVTTKITEEKKRYLALLEEGVKRYGEDGDWHFISSPGRSEIGGNHTDHQHGHVLACALNIDNLCCVKASTDNMARFKDSRFDEIVVDLGNLSLNTEEYNTSNSLVRGIANRLNELGYKIGGFAAVCDSRVLIGSGISSSACFEVMVVEIFNCLFNNEKVNPVERAIISQYAENVYFGKPSGLMDQMAISVGGFTGIDFKNPNEPVIENSKFSFFDHGYELALVNTKGDHADLSHEYAAIPNEIRAVSNAMGVKYLRDKEPEYFFSHIKELREEVKNDRGILRAFHFYNEDERAVKEKEATQKDDADALLKLMNESGRSSFMFLQNVYPASRTVSQSLAVGLAISEKVLNGQGACRVHGGGFDGTIQVVVPLDKVEEFKKEINAVFGDDAIMFVRVRKTGCQEVIC